MFALFSFITLLVVTVAFAFVYVTFAITLPAVPTVNASSPVGPRGTVVETLLFSATRGALVLIDIITIQRPMGKLPFTRAHF